MNPESVEKPDEIALFHKEKTGWLRSFQVGLMCGVPNAGMSGYYQSNDLYTPHFNLTAGAYGVPFTFGRYEIYAKHGYEWHVSPREYMPFDSYNPIGYFDAITTSGVAFGWACDQDKPTGSVSVDLVVGGTLVAEGWANVSSEAAVNSACGGGFAHRFAMQLPSWTKGYQISALAADYTWYGGTQLPGCPGCSW